MKRSVKCCHGGEAQEKIVYYIHKLQSQEARHSTQGHQEKRQVVKRQKGQKQVAVFATAFIGISTGKVRQNRENSQDWLV